ncbi:MAG: hypothetical protein N3D73_02130 [Candidatus Diapherotrites archaeon]|nr:hypothetical protein [Candidatus Diapherotrites archaeon]
MPKPKNFFGKPPERKQKDVTKINPEKEQKKFFKKTEQRRRFLIKPIPKEPVLDLKIPYLQRGEYTTKLFGLQTLKKFGTRFGRVLDYVVYNDASQFSIKHFPDPTKGRLLIRTDPNTYKNIQTMEQWATMPRTILDLNNIKPSESTRIVKKWMTSASKSHPNIRFIIHKVRNLDEYAKNYQLNIDLNSNLVRLFVRPSCSAVFRDEPTEQIIFHIDDKLYEVVLHDPTDFKNRYYRSQINSIVGDERLASTILSMTNYFIFDYLVCEGYKRCKKMEVSFVTYKDNPAEIEFYDLLLGKDF